MAVYSTIIVNYNAGNWLLRSTRSALAHSAGNVIVVDNASMDDSVVNTQRLLEADDTSRLHWQLNQENIGFAAANNQALHGLQGDYAVLMNPDCELYPQTIDTILQQFAEHPKLGIASCSILNEDGSLQITCRRRLPTPWSALVRMLALHKLFPNAPIFTDFDYGDKVSSKPIEFVEAISGAFMIVRLQALNDVGLLDEDYFMHCEDLDWCKRFDDSDWQVGFVPSARVLHAKGVSSQSRPAGVLIDLHKSMNRFFDKHYKTSYSWPLRYLVKLGIALSLLARIIKAKIAGVLSSKGKH